MQEKVGTNALLLSEMRNGFHDIDRMQQSTKLHALSNDGMNFNRLFDSYFQSPSHKGKPDGSLDVDDSWVQRIRDASSVSFPQNIQISINSKIHTFNLKDVNQKEGNFIEFIAHDTLRPSVPLLIKILDPRYDQYTRSIRSSFENEVNALEKLSRLVYADKKNLVIIHRKIIGESLDKILARKNDARTIEKLTKKYLDLPSSFAKKWNLVHFDIQPKNVIVDGKGEMHLINFSIVHPLEDIFQLMISSMNARNAIGIRDNLDPVDYIKNDLSWMVDFPHKTQN